MNRKQEEVLDSSQGGGITTLFLGKKDKTYKKERKWKNNMLKEALRQRPLVYS